MNFKLLNKIILLYKTEYKFKFYDAFIYSILVKT